MSPCQLFLLPELNRPERVTSSKPEQQNDSLPMNESTQNCHHVLHPAPKRLQGAMFACELLTGLSDGILVVISSSRALLSRVWWLLGPTQPIHHGAPTNSITSEFLLFIIKRNQEMEKETSLCSYFDLVEAAPRGTKSSCCQ